MAGDKRIKTNAIVLMGVVVLLFSTFIVLIFYSLYQQSQENITNMWRNNSLLSGQEISYFVLDSVDAMDFTSKQINRMVEEGASEKEILAYLEEESRIYPEAVSGNINGVYAYYKGTYLDGMGWEPEDDFDATERPWYQEAMAGEGAIVMVPPYRDLQTGRIITTIARRLDDGESVLGMDVELTDIQKMTEEAMRGEAGGMTLVMSRAGFVVAHSQKKQVGTDFTEKNPEMWKCISEHLFKGSDRNVTFRAREKGRNYIVFAEVINDSWISAMILDEGRIFQSLRYIYIASASALIIVITVLLAIFLYIIRKIAQADELKYLSETDKLTGINNRGAGEEKIAKLMDTGEAGMFLLMDADNFKSVNDNYGHDVGDKVIIAIANCLKTSLRDSDVVMRLGGDEFAAYAKGVADSEIGERIVNRFFGRIDAIDIPELGDRKITVSVGASFYPGDDTTFEQLYKAADEGTYTSKQTQGNRVTF